MVLDDGDDALQNEGTDESVPEVPKEAEKKTETFQEQRARKPKKKQAARTDGGKISSSTRSHSPLLSLLHANTDSHFPLSSSVATYPLFTIHAVAKPQLMNKVKNGMHSRNPPNLQMAG